MNEAVAPAHHMKPMNCVHPIISSVSAGSCNAVAFARINTESFRAFRGGGTPEPRWMCVCIMQRMTRTQREVNSGETSTAAGAHVWIQTRPHSHTHMAYAPRILRNSECSQCVRGDANAETAITTPYQTKRNFIYSCVLRCAVSCVYI